MENKMETRNIIPIVENLMHKNMENEMEAGPDAEDNL